MNLNTPHYAGRETDEPLTSRLYYGDRMGQPFTDWSYGKLAAVLTTGEIRQVQALKVGDSVSFTRGVSGPVGKTLPFAITRVQ
jgi:hypothetical protein